MCRDPWRGLDWTRCSDIGPDFVCPWVVRNQSAFFSIYANPWTLNMPLSPLALLYATNPVCSLTYVCSLLMSRGSKQRALQFLKYHAKGTRQFSLLCYVSYEPSGTRA